MQYATQLDTLSPSRTRPVAARQQTTSRFLSYCAYGICFFSLLNLGGVAVQLFNYDNVPVNPLIAAILALPLCLGIRRRVASPVITVLLVFWIIFFVGGMLPGDNSYNRRVTDYEKWQVILKSLLNLVIIPFLVTLHLSRRDIPRLARLFGLITAFSSVLGILQAAIPGFLPEMTNAPGRGAGLYVNPNAQGLMCTIALLLISACPFSSGKWQIIAKMVLVLGIAATMSRAAVLGLVICTAVYTLSIRDSKYLFGFAIGAPIAIALMLAVADSMASTDLLSRRIESTRAIMRGDVAAAAEYGDRRTILREGLRQITNNDWVFGLGHGAAKVLILDRTLRRPTHNAFLYVWANSGIAALVAFLFMWMRMFRSSTNLPHKSQRSTMIAMVTLVVFHAFFTDDILFAQHFSPAFAFAGLVFARHVTAETSQR